MLGNVRDHIESQQNDHRPSFMPYRGFRRPRQLKPDLSKIFGAPQFSTFSTASVKPRNSDAQMGGPHCPQQRTSSARPARSEKCQLRKMRLPRPEIEYRLSRVSLRVYLRLRFVIAQLQDDTP